MRTINIRATKVKQITKQICLGNGFRKNFASQRQALAFVADTNRFLTECLVILNETYVSAFVQYRAMWFIAINQKSGTRTNYLQLLKVVQRAMQSSEDMMDKFNSSWGSNQDPFFSFIDTKKACIFLQDAMLIMENFNRDRKLTTAMYQCRVLRKRCLLVNERLQTYGSDQ